jgi:ectoine hydroxylase-related dioxygenase (phytanoyl-CoA dioxygenase family)
MSSINQFTVPPETVEMYREEGTACVRRAFSPAWVERLLAAYDDITAKFDAERKPDAGEQLVKRENPGGMPPLTYVADSDGNARLKNVVWANAACAEWLEQSDAASIVSQVIGARTLRFYWDQYFTKSSNSASGVTAWHHDIAAFSFYGMQLPSFWVALTDIDVDNAPLITAAGSHKRTHVMYRPLKGAENVPLPEGYGERSEMLAWLDSNPDCLRTWTVKAGDALVIHPYTYHASLPRKPNAGRRVAYTSRWLGDDVIWWKREMTFNYPDDARFSDVRQGQPPPERGFPLVWPRPAPLARGAA